MNRVLINILINDFEEPINKEIPNNIPPNDIIDASPPFFIGSATFNEFKEYVHDALKQLRSKMKTLTIVVGNSNNYTGYSSLSGKSEAVESDYISMGIVRYKIIFKWLKYPNRYIYIDIRDLTLHFDAETIISDSNHDLYDPDNSKVLTSGDLKEIFNKIKEIVDSIKDITDGAKNITESIEKITNNIKDITDKINDLIKRLD
jgi:hypothetical protein